MLSKLHPADQHIVCKGAAKVWNSREGAYVDETCGMVFTRAGAYMRHIESGECRFIKKRHIEDERAQKQVVKDIMKDPEQFAQNLRGKEHYLNGEEKQTVVKHIGSLRDDADEQTLLFDGVPFSLMDNDNTSQVADRPPLYPKKRPEKMIETEEPLSRRRVINAFPELRPRLIPGSSTPAASPRLLPSVVSRPHSAMSATADTESNANDSVSTSTAKTPLAGSSWTINSTKELFPDAEKTSNVDNNWMAVEAARESSIVENSKTNLFTSRFWDNTHPGYDSDIFRRERRDGTLVFACPWPTCRNMYSTAGDITTHIRNFHINSPKSCKRCFKKFKGTTALVQHFEASSRGSKCEVAKQSDFNRILDEVTGGVLSVESYYEEKIVGLNMPDEESGKMDETGLPVWNKPNGTKNHEFQAELPTRLAEPNW